MISKDFRKCLTGPYRLLRRTVGFIVRTVLLLYTQFRISRKVARLKGKDNVRVAFMVVYESVFPLERLFRLMRDDPTFNPVIIVIPDLARGHEHMERVFKKTYKTLKEKYGDYVVGAIRNGEFEDFCGKFDLYTTMNPYAGMTHRYYSIPYMAKHGCPVFAVRYFYDAGNIYSDSFNKLSELSFLWRFYAQDPDDKKAIARRQKILSFFNRVRTIGVPKMDDFANRLVEENGGKRKCILLAPHHSIDPIGEYGFSIGNFDKYSNFILLLPLRYPQINWIFRPHPLTIRSMVLSHRWSQDEAVAFIEKISGFPNVEYQDGGEYFDTFARSDALIQDCTSFLPEWYYTGKPQCFVLKDRESEHEQFLSRGRDLLSHVYKGFCEEDIVRFVEQVVLNGDDYMAIDRREYAKKLMYNYPHASEKLLEDIKRSVSLA